MEPKAIHYLVYTGGGAVAVYDPNWHRVEQLRVSRNDLQVHPGANAVTVETSSPGALPWLECQFIIKDKPMEVKQ